jgi:hypothetical protein
VSGLLTCSICGCQPKRKGLVILEPGVDFDSEPIAKCKSAPACRKRWSDRVGVRVVLEGGPPVASPELAHLAQARAARNDRYRRGLCCDCGRKPYSPGRPRCERCHKLLLDWRKLGYG